MATTTRVQVEPGLESVYELLRQVQDPELPGLSIVDLGMLRGIHREGDKMVVEITTTYSGCPALAVISDEIRKVVQQAGFQAVDVNTVLRPAWSTDDVSVEARRKLQLLHIVPPASGEPSSLALEVACPVCNSPDTSCTSEFGSTPCKSLWRCNGCKEPFEVFKRL